VETAEDFHHAVFEASGLEPGRAVERG